jgi:hypothetical protein
MHLDIAHPKTKKIKARIRFLGSVIELPNKTKVARPGMVPKKVPSANSL